MYVCACTSLYVYACMFMYACMYACMYVCVYARMYACMSRGAHLSKSQLIAEVHDAEGKGPYIYTHTCTYTHTYTPSFSRDVYTLKKDLYAHTQRR